MAAGVCDLQLRTDAGACHIAGVRWGGVGMLYEQSLCKKLTLGERSPSVSVQRFYQLRYLGVCVAGIAAANRRLPGRVWPRLARRPRHRA